ncbi:MAG: GTA-gp10 family protein [Paracoccaceae bacterium]
MENPWRGDVALTINGERCVLRLTLGALAALEAELEAESLVSVVERFEGGQFSARDVMALLRAGLLGGGHEAIDLAQAEIEGGPVKGARVAAELLARAFTMPGS